MARPSAPPRGILFDLDGTLLDTAPDMGAALTSLRAEHGLPPLAHADMRPHVSRGANALVRLGLGESAASEHAARRERFLSIYQTRVAVDTRPFPEVDALLNELDQRRIPWAIVTNKPSHLTQLVLQSLNFGRNAKIVLCGDSLSQRKPSPMPLLHAARVMEVAPAECLFLGDAECDMQAAHAAGMVALGARYGYFSADDRPESWPADGWIDSPLGLLEWI